MPEQADWARIAVAVAATIVLAYVAAVVAGRITRSALSAMFHEIREGAASAIHQPTRIIRGAVFVVTLLALVLPALELAGVQTTIGLTSKALTAWLFGSGLRILVIFVLSYALLRIIAETARRLEAQLGEATSADMLERLKRARTVSSLVQHALTALVVGIAGLMVLHELQVDIMPILTGAGVVGLAIGFGAQTLVKDLIAGFFLTLENQVRIGDVVNINGTGGLVEEINLRTIVLRDGDGAVHVFPNGFDRPSFESNQGLRVCRRGRRRRLHRERRPGHGPAARNRGRARQRPEVRRERPRTGRGSGHRQLRGRAPRDPIADEDGATQAMGYQPRVPPPDCPHIRRARHHDAGQVTASALSPHLRFCLPAAPTCNHRRRRSPATIPQAL